jgi:hypothetical protein
MSPFVNITVKKILTQTVFYCLDRSTWEQYTFMTIHIGSCIFIFVEIKVVVAHIGIISHPQIFYGYGSTYSFLKERISPHYYFNNLMFVTIPFYKEKY